jgi:surface antigen
MASMGSSSPGHVAIVEEIDRSNGQLRIRISEMNNGDANGLGNPEEFRDNHWMVRNSDNTWTYDTQGNKGVLTFAALPK